MEGIERISYIEGNTWIFLVILSCLALLAYVHQAYPARFGKLFRATFNERITRQVMREEMVFSHRASLILMLISCITCALVLHLSWNFYSGQEKGFVSFGLLFLALMLGFFLRQGIRAILNAILGSQSGLKEFNFVSSLIYKVLGITLLPVVIITSMIGAKYAMALIILAIACFVLAAFFRYYRGWRIGRHVGSGVYHLMIYLCTLEILPALVVIKGVMLGSSI